LKEKLQADLITAMKGKEELKLSTLRMLTSAIRNKEIEKRPAVLTDDDMLTVVASEVKKRTDAITDYTKGGRPELAQKENTEKMILESYLPAQLSSAELSTLVSAAIKESSATAQKDFGAVMKLLMPKVKGKAPGNAVSDLVKKHLAV
ncbi:GatB/YqeY domain-containing protein, partial [Candidatus Uhrbacteria bacterium]|nr:GatB/YqeY domain-containing protein [Candidatus Uhrbacteria bacterium]